MTKIYKKKGLVILIILLGLLITYRKIQSNKEISYYREKTYKILKELKLVQNRDDFIFKYEGKNIRNRFLSKIFIGKDYEIWIRFDCNEKETDSFFIRENNRKVKSEEISEKDIFNYIKIFRPDINTDNLVKFKKEPTQYYFRTESYVETIQGHLSENNIEIGFDKDNILENIDINLSIKKIDRDIKANYSLDYAEKKFNEFLKKEYSDYTKEYDKYLAYKEEYYGNPVIFNNYKSKIKETKIYKEVNYPHLFYIFGKRLYKMKTEETPYGFITIDVYISAENGEVIKAESSYVRFHNVPD